jgi:hypothetical protein
VDDLRGREAAAPANKNGKEMLIAESPARMIMEEVLTLFWLCILS